MPRMKTWLDEKGTWFAGDIGMLGRLGNIWDCRGSRIGLKSLYF